MLFHVTKWKTFFKSNIFVKKTFNFGFILNTSVKIASQNDVFKFQLSVQKIRNLLELLSVNNVISSVISSATNVTEITQKKLTTAKTCMDLF